MSFLAWAVGSLVLALTLWYDASLSGPRGDVAAGLAGLGVAIGFGVFIVSTTIGLALGLSASRRAPAQRAASVALGLNVVTLFGVLLGTVLVLFT
jgi:hypothetical protein